MGPVDQSEFFGYAGDMQVQGADKLCRADVFPEAKIDPIIPHHPPQEHVDPFTGRSLYRRGDVLLGPLQMRKPEEVLFEVIEALLHSNVTRLHSICEGGFEAWILLVMHIEELHKVQEVIISEGAVAELQQFFPFGG